jgi:hypothetical protein
MKHLRTALRMAQVRRKKMMKILRRSRASVMKSLTLPTPIYLSAEVPMVSNIFSVRPF